MGTLKNVGIFQRFQVLFDKFYKAWYLFIIDYAQKCRYGYLYLAP